MLDGKRYFIHFINVSQIFSITISFHILSHISFHFVDFRHHTMLITLILLSPHLKSNTISIEYLYEKSSLSLSHRIPQNYHHRCNNTYLSITVISHKLSSSLSRLHDFSTVHKISNWTVIPLYHRRYTYYFLSLSAMPYYYIAD